MASSVHSLSTGASRASSPCAPTREGRLGTACCFVPDGPPPARPDPAIYSQAALSAQGVAPTWDNPDILTNFWKPFRLMPEAAVVVRNLSSTVSAVNVQVQISTSAFGIGGQRLPMSSQFVSLAPSQQRGLLFAFPQALLQAAEQRIAVHVRLIHPTDADQTNNEGSQAIAVAYTSEAGRQFSFGFPVINPTGALRQVNLSLLPSALSASIATAAVALAPFEQVLAAVKVVVPASLHGTAASPVRSDVTVVGRDGAGRLIDGLTMVVWVDD